MANFFIRRPIVAIVIAIVTVIIGGITIALAATGEQLNIRHIHERALATLDEFQLLRHSTLSSFF